MIFEDKDIQEISKRVLLEIEKKYILFPKDYSEIHHGTAPDYVMRVINFVCEHFNISRSIVLSENRAMIIVEKRQIIAYLVRKYSDEKISLDLIGKLLGNKNHATIFNNDKKLKNRMETELKFLEEIEDLEKIFIAKIGKYEQIAKSRS